MKSKNKGSVQRNKRKREREREKAKKKEEREREKAKDGHLPSIELYINAYIYIFKMYRKLNDTKGRYKIIHH